MMAIASLLALVVDGVWLQNIAFVLFVVFWVQGLAIVHWMQAQQILPRIDITINRNPLPAASFTRPPNAAAPASIFRPSPGRSP